MELTKIKDYKFFVNVGFVSLLAAILTMIITQVVKIILVKKGFIKSEIEATKKDLILSWIGRICALVTYSSIYICEALFLKHDLVFDEALIMGLLSGSAITLTIAKALYTVLHQYFKKNDVFERLEYAEKIMKTINECIFKRIKDNDDSHIINELKNDLISNNPTWILTNKKKEGKNDEKNNDK